jgi:thiosulfate reductase cytochrome b subunit
MEKITIHPRYVRVFHWLNAIAIFMMVGSGWRIYDAAPVFHSFTFPTELTIGDWLGGALQWHFAAMWLFVVNLGIYLALGVVNGHFRQKMLPLYPGQVVGDFWAALRFKLAHASHDYNAVQKLSYLGVIFAMVMTFVSGLAMWKPVQFQALSWIVGSYDNARIVHFTGMSLICAFVVVHLALVLLVPSTLLPMITGKAKPFPQEEKPHAVQA